MLDNNNINKIPKGALDKLTKLENLSLNNNSIPDLEQIITACRKFPHLTFLSLLKNPCCPTELSLSDNDKDDYKRYRYYMLYCLPKLKFLDSSPVTSSELQTAKKRGKYCKVVTTTDFIPESEETDTAIYAEAEKKAG